jgi:DNA-binding response OmpR family regulator
MMPEQRILLVEDDRELARLLGLVLLTEGYAVEVAGTVAQARERLDAVRVRLGNRGSPASR